MAFSNNEVQEINYYLGRPVDSYYLTEIKNRLDEISAMPSFGIEIENRLREKLRDLKQIEQQIRDARKRFGVVTEPNTQYRSNLEIAQLYGTFSVNVRNFAEELGIPIRKIIYSNNVSYTR